ncbi:MAG TPA: LuxR C-terminal-related transcriptional regulator, partial [Gemmatimonadales bacterium]|nr:LuxR C-terminal-related transcriptional regulator [Gemmatimonadales bacterium]
AKAFIESGRGQHPGCLVLDVRMPELSGLDLQQALDEAGCHMPIIFITGYGDVPTAVRAIRRGAVDMLIKPVDERQLFAAVSRALQIDRAEQAVRAEQAELGRRYARLTPRERQVFALVVAGLLNKQVAARLGTSERTVKVHRARVMRKLGVESFAELVRLGTQLGIGPAPVARFPSPSYSSATRLPQGPMADMRVGE